MPFIPINKPGGSGAEALRYVLEREGDDHTVMITLNSFYTTPLIQKDLEVDVSKFTPIGRMALDTFMLWVNSDREDIDDLDSYVRAVKSAGKPWKVGGTGSGQEDSILTAIMEKEFDYSVTYIPFPGGGTVAKNLIGQHIDSTVNNPSEQNEFYRAGAVKPIVQFTDKRMNSYPDVPTAKELGYDIEYYMQRSISGPPGMSQDAQDWYAAIFQSVFESEDWKKFCKEDGLTCDEWLTTDELDTFHKQQRAKHEELINSVGAEAIINK